MASAGHSLETGTPARMHRVMTLFCKSWSAMAKSSSPWCMALHERAYLDEALLLLVASAVVSTSVKIAAVAWLSRWATMVASKDLSIVLLLLLLVAIPDRNIVFLELLLLVVVVFVVVVCCPVALASAFFALL